MFKNVKKEEITVPAQMSYLIQVREFVEHIGKRYKFHDKVINSFKLVIDEACTNIIRHGYRDIKNGEITIKAIIRRLSLTILIIDQGRSYDPSQAATPDLGKYVDIGKKGGLGILMMRKLMDDLQYSVTERGNEFRLTKYRENAQESRLVEKWHLMNLKTKYSLVAAFIFTIIILVIFVPLIVQTDKNVKNDVLTTTAAGCQSLADNVISDMLSGNDFNLFEPAVALQKNYENIIKDVFILDTDSGVIASTSALKSFVRGKYKYYDDATMLDSIQQVKVAFYSIPKDTITIYDLSTEIRQSVTGTGAILGSVHVWIDAQTIRNMAARRELNLYIILFSILVIGYLGSFFLIHRILTPFHSLADWVRLVVHGKVDQDEIDIDASDELGEIAQAFNEMTQKFRKAQVNLMEQQKLQKELQVAQEIQQMLLPSDFPKVEGYEIASFYEAAKEVGGDLFDFVEVDNDTIGICVADVSGKGVPGSLIMTMIRTALRLESRGNKNPADVLARVNAFVADDMKRGMFVTMFYMVLDSRNRIIHYASAGHNPMILYRGSTKQTYYLNPSGFPVGIQLPDPGLFAAKIETDSIRLREDDILVLYTDGITEAMNSQRDLYREERFLEAIRNNAHLDVAEFIKSINEDLKNFTGGAQQNDDITFVSIKEKMMQSEVVFRIQKELSDLIAKGIKVKDALDQLRVSPYFYYKYKDVIERGGMEGLRNFLEEQDHIEKKHLSLELKTKIFSIISKNPEYGAKRIADELKTPEYGNIEVDPNRIYNELVKLRLNTKKMRERHLEKGKRTHFKQPGTPLLTLDGKVILDFESSEKVIEKRHGESDVKFRPQEQPSQTKRKEFIRRISNTPEEKEGTPIIKHQAPKPFKPEPVTEPKPAEETKPKVEVKPVSKPEAAPEKEKPAEKIKPKISEPIVEKPVIDITEKEQPERVPVKEQPKPQPAEKSVTREEILEKVTSIIDQDKVIKFYQMTQDDLSAVEKTVAGLETSTDLKKDVKKITVILSIATKHPILKDIEDIKLIFERSKETFDFIHENADSLDSKLIINSAKDLLNCIRKDNKLDDYSRIFETINHIGLIQHKLRRQATNSKLGQSNQMDRIRKKIADNDIVSTRSILESLAKEQNK
jgi:serine phosphatase RsbU (regulator of sigma subunit)/anti-sigma regulatory factor (Ser/Thr protein kinase)